MSTIFYLYTLIQHRTFVQRHVPVFAQESFEVKKGTSLKIGKTESIVTLLDVVVNVVVDVVSQLTLILHLLIILDKEPNIAIRKYCL